MDISKFQHLYPFKSNFIEVEGLKYHYIDEGKGKPVVMIHGNPTWSFYFRNLINSLKPNYRTIAMDHIGCGMSDKPPQDKYDYRLKSRVENLETLLDQVVPDEKVSLVVHDWGGMIGMAYALKHPEKIEKLVITNTAGFHPPGDKGLPLRLWLLKYIRPFATLGILGFNLFSFAALFMAPRKKLHPFVKAGLTAPYNNWKNRIATLKFVQDIPLDKNEPSFDLVKYVDDNIHKLKEIPMMILWGKHDFVFDTDYYNEWIKRFPEAESHFFKDAGHYLFEDLPEKTSSLIESFLK